MPAAVTLKLAVSPTLTATLCGPVVMLAATGGAVTVKTAAVLVTLPALLVMVTLKLAPLSPMTVAGVV